MAFALAKLRTSASDHVVAQLVGVPAGSVSLFVKQGLTVLAAALQEAQALPPLSLQILLQARHTFGSTPAITSHRYRLPNCVGALDSWVTPIVCHGGDLELQAQDYGPEPSDPMGWCPTPPGAVGFLRLWGAQERPRVPAGFRAGPGNL